MADSTPFASVKIEGVDLRSQLQSIDVEDHDRAIDRARIVFDSADDVAKIVREQARVQVRMGWSDQGSLVFEGLVAGFKGEAIGAGQSRVTLTAYDLSYILKQDTSKPREFTSGKLSDALRAILADYPTLKVGQILPDPDPTFSPAHPWRKLVGKSDWDFIQEAALAWKARAFVEVNKEVSQFYFVSEASLLTGDPMGVLHYCPGGVGPLIKFDFKRVGSGAAPLSATTVIDPNTGEPVSQPAPPPAVEAPLDVGPGASTTLSEAAGLMAKSPGQPADARPKDVVRGLPSDPERALSRIRQDPTLVLGFSGDGLCRGTIMLRAKGKVTIKGLPPWVEGDWYVHKVNHIYTRIAVPGKDTKMVDRSTYQTKFAVTR